MYTKSLIQQTIEKNDRLASMKEGLQNLMDKYLIEDSIFSYNNGNVMQVTKGYFVVEEEYNDFNEAMKNCNPDEDVIRITENKEFQIGRVYKKLIECPDDKTRLSINNI